MYNPNEKIPPHYRDRSKIFLVRFPSFTLYPPQPNDRIFYSHSPNVGFLRRYQLHDLADLILKGDYDKKKYI